MWPCPIGGGSACRVRLLTHLRSRYKGYGGRDRAPHEVPQEALRQYLSLERADVRETRLSLPPPLGGTSAVPLLRWRLQEEVRRLEEQRAEGYLRMGEKTEHLIGSIRRLIAAPEQGHGTDAE